MDRFREVEIFAVWALCAACIFALFAAAPAKAARLPTMRGAPVVIEVGKR